MCLNWGHKLVEMEKREKMRMQRTTTKKLMQEESKEEAEKARGKHTRTASGPELEKE